MSVLVTAPVYNEVATLEKVFAEIRRYHKGDIIAVDDGSTDGSSEILEKIDGISVIRHEKNMGYGQSVIDGLNYAVKNGYDRVITIDCDEQHEPRLIPSMCATGKEFDVVSGSRYLRDNPTDDPAPWERFDINKKITKIINEITGYNLTDTFCGFKCYRCSAIAKLSLDEAGYAQPVQFWIQAWHFGLSVRELAIPRIYKNLNRTFGGGIDDPISRLAYYKQVMQKEIERWSISLSSERIRTI